MSGKVLPDKKVTASPVVNIIEKSIVQTAPSKQLLMVGSEPLRAFP